MADPDWLGEYQYDTSLGNTVGGSPIIMLYALRVTKTDCSLSIDGFQTMDRIKCNAVAGGNRLSVNFISYANGSVKNDFGVQVYKVREPLFDMTRKDGVIMTIWKSERPDEKIPLTGEYFKPIPNIK